MKSILTDIHRISLVCIALAVSIAPAALCDFSFWETESGEHELWWSYNEYTPSPTHTAEKTPAGTPTPVPTNTPSVTPTPTSVYQWNDATRLGTGTGDVQIEPVNDRKMLCTWFDSGVVKYRFFNGVYWTPEGKLPDVPEFYKLYSSESGVAAIVYREGVSLMIRRWNGNDFDDAQCLVELVITDALVQMSTNGKIFILGAEERQIFHYRFEAYECITTFNIRNDDPCMWIWLPDSGTVTKNCFGTGSDWYGLGDFAEWWVGDTGTHFYWVQVWGECDFFTSLDNRLYIYDNGARYQHYEQRYIEYCLECFYPLPSHCWEYCDPAGDLPDAWYQKQWQYGPPEETPPYPHKNEKIPDTGTTLGFKSPERYGENENRYIQVNRYEHSTVLEAPNSDCAITLDGVTILDMDHNANGPYILIYSSGNKLNACTADPQRNGWDSIPAPVDHDVDAVNVCLDADDSIWAAYRDHSDVWVRHNASGLPPTPTMTPTPTPTDTPTITPTLTPTPSPDPTAAPGVSLLLNSSEYRTGDFFKLRAFITGTSSLQEVDLYLLLNIQDAFWFWPGWTEQLDFRTIALKPNHKQNIFILDFEWPETPYYNFEAQIMAIIAEPSSYRFIGDLVVESFSF